MLSKKGEISFVEPFFICNNWLVHGLLCHYLFRYICRYVHVINEWYKNDTLMMMSSDIMKPVTTITYIDSYDITGTDYTVPVSNKVFFIVTNKKICMRYFVSVP